MLVISFIFNIIKQFNFFNDRLVNCYGYFEEHTK